MKVGFEKNEDPNVLARGMFEGREVVVLTAPSSSIDGQDGPVIIPTEDGKVTVVFSDEFVNDTCLPLPTDSPREMGEKMRQVTVIINHGVQVGLAYMNAHPEFHIPNE